MKKATKPQIMRDLRAMRDKKLEAKKMNNKKKVEELRKSLIVKHRPEIESLVKELNPIMVKVNKLAQTLQNDANINMNHYEYSSFLGSFTSVDRVERLISDRAGWYKGESQVLEDKLRKELNVLAKEWDNLLLNCSLMTAQQLREYLVENKIELPCMNEKEEVKTLTVRDVNLTLLFGGNKDNE